MSHVLLGQDWAGGMMVGFIYGIEGGYRGYTKGRERTDKEMMELRRGMKELWGKKGT